MRVLLASAEVTPFSKVGGLGDVAGALPKALQKIGVDVGVITPLYGSISKERFGLEPTPATAPFEVPVGATSWPAQVWHAPLPGTTVPVYFIASTAFFDRPGIYQDPETGRGYEDEAERFAFFSRGVLRACEILDLAPDILHLNDFHTSLVVGYLRYRPTEHPRVASSRTVFTIHNLGYQGVFPLSLGETVGLPPEASAPMAPLEFNHKANLMKLGVALADAVTTVSPTYALEIQRSPDLGMGLQGVLRHRSTSVTGILNGIDYEIWNTEHDPHIAAPYSVDDLSGKAENRARLLQTFGWEDQGDGPVVAMIGRLAAQKGWDLVLEAGRRMVKLGVRLAVLGTGDSTYERGLVQLSKRHPNRVGAALRFDEGLAHLMEAGADIFLMPSRYEPCGLNQMISLRYGTIPVVRDTGGLSDTITEYDPATGRGTGFLFKEYSAESMLKALVRAVKVFRQPELWSGVVRNAMLEDHSWESSAKAYLQLYERVAAQG
jgi:starch synthase